jgi:hypothetical protein
MMASCASNQDPRSLRQTITNLITEVFPLLKSTPLRSLILISLLDSSEDAFVEELRRRCRNLLVSGALSLSQAQQLIQAGNLNQAEFDHRFARRPSFQLIGPQATLPSVVIQVSLRQDQNGIFWFLVRTIFGTNEQFRLWPQFFFSLGSTQNRLEVTSMEELLEELMPRCDYSTNQSFDELLDELTSKSLPQHSNESSPPFENTERMCVSTNYPQTSQVSEVSVQRNTHHIASERVSTRFANKITQGGILQFECPPRCQTSKNVSPPVSSTWTQHPSSIS